MQKHPVTLKNVLQNNLVKFSLYIKLSVNIEKTLKDNFFKTTHNTF